MVYFANKKLSDSLGARESVEKASVREEVSEEPLCFDRTGWTVIVAPREVIIPRAF